MASQRVHRGGDVRGNVAGVSPGKVSRQPAGRRRPLKEEEGKCRREREGYGRVRAVVPRLLLGLAEGFVGIGGVRVGGERREQKLGDRGLVEAFIRCQCLIVVK